MKTSGSLPPNSSLLKWSYAACKPLYSTGVIASDFLRAIALLLVDGTIDELAQNSSDLAALRPNTFWNVHPVQLPDQVLELPPPQIWVRLRSMLAIRLNQPVLTQEAAHVAPGIRRRPPITGGAGDGHHPQHPGNGPSDLQVLGAAGQLV